MVNCRRVCTGCTSRKLTTANSCRALSFIYLTEKEDTHAHTHIRTHTLTHSRTLAQWSPSCTWPAPQCTANFLYFLRCCFVECLMRCTAKTNFPQLTFPFLNVIRCIFLVYFAVLFSIFSGSPLCDLMSFRCEVLRRCPCCPC